MSERSIWARVAILSLAAVMLAGVPYLLAWRWAPEGTRFAGFLLNPIDGFSYLAKMRQGADGGWLFRLPYANDPGDGVLLFIYPIFLGHLSRWLGTSLLPTYHAARLVAAAAMFAVAFIFLQRTVEPGRARWLAYLLVLFGAGQGWIAALAWGQTASDLWIAESMPFLSAYANAHFPLTAAAFLGLLALLARPERGRKRSRLLGAGMGFLLGAIQPFVMVVLAALLVGWLAWEWAAGGRRRGWIPDSHLMDKVWLAALAFLGAAPWMAYDLWISRVHAAISAWNAQNLTLSPALSEYVFGFGLLLPLALAGALRPEVHGRSQGRLLIAWAIGGLFLLYTPLPFQRRLSFMLYVPLAGLSALGLHHWLRGGRSFRLAAATLIAFSIPSQALILAAGLGGVRRGDPALVHLPGETEAYAWIEMNIPREEVVLASPETGNRLPAFADVRVLYGHPFETPHADTWRETVQELFAWVGDEAQGLEELNALGVHWVFYGRRERALGTPSWLAALSPAARFEDVVIYRLAEP